MNGTIILVRTAEDRRFAERMRQLLLRGYMSRVNFSTYDEMSKQLIKNLVVYYIIVHITTIHSRLLS